MNTGMVDPCINIISDFGKASGSKTNLIKTKCLTNSNLLLWRSQVTGSNGPEMVLGIPVGKSVDMNPFWLNKIAKIKSCLAVWKTRSLTYKGKVHLLKSYGMSNLLYSMEVKTPPNYIIKEVDRLFNNFLWDDRARGKVKREISILPRMYGGLGVPDLHTSLVTRRVKFILKVIEDPEEKWKLIPRMYLSRLDLDYCQKYFLLNVTDSRAHIGKNIPEFYKECILHYQQYLKVCKDNPESKDEILKQKPTSVWY